MEERCPDSAAAGSGGSGNMEKGAFLEQEVAVRFQRPADQGAGPSTRKKRLSLTKTWRPGSRVQLTGVGGTPNMEKTAFVDQNMAARF